MQSVASTINSLWLLMRPKGLICVLMLPTLGYGFAHWDRALTARAFEELLVVWAAWACFHAGSMWLNADLDRDERPVIFGTQVAHPKLLAGYGYASLVIGVGLLLLLGPSVALLGLVVACLAALYSARGVALKGHPIGGPLVNLIGYGLLSPVAGWWVVGVAPNFRTLISLLVTCLLIMVTYFVLQAYQQQDDADRGYRTMVVTHGPARTLGLAQLLLWVSFGLWVGLAVGGWYPRMMLVGIPVWLWWARWLRRWQVSAAPSNFVWPIGFARRAFVVGAVLFSLVFGVYVINSLMGRSVAGLATASVTGGLGW